MNITEAVEAINNFEKVLDDYSAYFVDWEALSNDKNYRPEFPPNLIKARADIKLLAAELGAVIKP